MTEGVVACVRCDAAWREVALLPEGQLLVCALLVFVCCPVRLSDALPVFVLGTL
jgi:hypothetical protein